MFELKSNRVAQVELIGRWSKGGYDAELQFRRTQYWSRGSIWLEECPDLSSYQEEDGINLYDRFEFDEWTFEEGHHEWAFPQGMSEEIIAVIIEADEEGDLSDAGWEVIESETWFYGPLIIHSRA